MSSPRGVRLPRVGYKCRRRARNRQRQASTRPVPRGPDIESPERVIARDRCSSTNPPSPCPDRCETSQIILQRRRAHGASRARQTLRSRLSGPPSLDASTNIPRPPRRADQCPLRASLTRRHGNLPSRNAHRLRPTRESQDVKFAAWEGRASRSGRVDPASQHRRCGTTAFDPTAANSERRPDKTRPASWTERLLRGPPRSISPFLSTTTSSCSPCGRT
jgi:hypothetical protein